MLILWDVAFWWKKNGSDTEKKKKEMKSHKEVINSGSWLPSLFPLLSDSGIFVFLSDLVSLFVHPKESRCDKGYADTGERRLKEWWRDRKGTLRDRVEVEFSLFYLLTVLYSAFSMLTMNYNLNCYLQKKLKWILSN